VSTSDVCKKQKNRETFLPFPAARFEGKKTKQKNVLVVGVHFFFFDLFRFIQAHDARALTTTTTTTTCERARTKPTR